MLKTVGFPSTRTGDQTIVNGNLVIGTAGKGIDFSINPSAPGMTTELLNDYEEGTFTPVLTYSTPGTVAITYVAGSQKGYYTKVGNLVTIVIDLRINTFSKGTASGFVQVTGLPFAAKNTGGFGRAFVTIAVNAANFTGIPLAVVNSADTSMTLLQVSSGGGQASISDPVNSAAYYLSGSYLV